MSVLLITGPPASGKNTVAETLGKRLQNVAVIDVDHVRQMVRQPACDPWQGDEGPRQRALSIYNTCSMSLNFENHQFDTIVVDVLTEE